jgi:glycosyltransferase involved in cell wall biosynthesis
VSRLTRAKLGDVLEWGGGVFSGEDELHLFGPMQEQMRLPAWVRYHGPVHPQALREQWFPGAAGLVTLSRHAEGRPQAMLEAMAAGLPVIASGIPAHRDFIRDGENGCLVDDAASLAQAVHKLADPEVNRCVGEAGREWMRTHLGTWDDTAARYVTLYRELLEQRRDS